MTIEEYTKLTGMTVASNDMDRLEAIIRRCEARLGSLLGYSLSGQKEWTELGKMQFSGYVPFPSLPVDAETKRNLLPADPVTGVTYLFNYDELDKHIRISPFKSVHRAKIVLPIDEDQFITIYELDDVTPYLNDAGLVVAINRKSDWFKWTWYARISRVYRLSLMIAIEGEPMELSCDRSYDDLRYLLADMVAYYSDPNYSLLGNISSESIDSHSYTRRSTGATPDLAAPQGQASAKKIIEKYAGPSAFRKMVR